MSKKLNKVGNFIKKNDTNIMTGVGIVDGLCLGGYLWYKTGQKVFKIAYAKEQELGRKLTKKEFIKATWKMFILPAINTIVSGGLLIYSAKVGNKRLAALGAAYNLTEVAFQQYIDKTKEIVSESKQNDIKEKVCKESINSEEAKDKVVIMAGNNDDILVHEPLTDRYFMSNWVKIQNAALDLNLEAENNFDGKISLSDWFDSLGLPKTDISDNIGWDIQKHGKNGKIVVDFITILTEDKKPCVEIYYNTRPEYFDKY